MSNQEVSRSLNNKYKQHYRAFLSPSQVKRLIKQKQFLEFEGLVSAARIQAYGDQAIAAINKTEISVAIKTVNNRKINTSHFQWGSDGLEALSRASDAYDHFTFHHQGNTDCKVKSSGRSSRQTCYFGAQLNTKSDLDRFTELLAQRYLQNPRSYIVIEVIYRHSVHVDCVGHRSQAIVRGINAKPKLHLRNL